jgi:hypothetical protein
MYAGFLNPVKIDSIGYKFQNSHRKIATVIIPFWLKRLEDFTKGGLISETFQFGSNLKKKVSKQKLFEI